MADDNAYLLDTAAQGARVMQDGLAILHAGELVLPAAGSEAQAEQVLADANAVVHFHFPVEIEVRAAPDALSPEAVAERALLGLADGLANG